jgi:hypothetical protein
MKKNVGGLDRILRIVIGVLLVGGNLINYYILKNPYCPWANLGWIPLLTGVFRFCPVYLPSKRSTVKE